MGSNVSVIEEFAKTIAELKHRTVEINDHAFWSRLFTCPKGMYHGELFDHINSADIIELRLTVPENLAVLIFKCVEQILLFSKEKSFWKTEGDKSSSASTALCLLARILPHILYRIDPADYPKSMRARVSEYAPDFAMHVLVNNMMCIKDKSAVVTKKNRSGRNDDDDDGHDHDDEGEHVESHLVFPSLEENRPLGDTMMRSICAVAFVPGFTVHKDQYVKEGDKNKKPDENRSAAQKEHYPYVTHPEILWRPGIAASSNDTGTIEQSDQCDINRSLVVRTLLATCSSQAYAANGNVPARLRYLLNDPSECPMGPHLAASLLNEIGSYVPYGALPYTSHLVWQREQLVAECMSLVTVLLDTSVFHQEVMLPASSQKKPDGQQQPPPRPQKIHPDHAMNGHAMWSLVNNMTQEDCERWLNCFFLLVQNNAYSRMTYLPGSQRALPFRDECFIVLWKMVYKSADFRRMFCKDEKTCRRIVVPLVTLLVDAIEANDARASMLQMAVMFMETLSMERDFSLALNEPFVDYVPFKLPAWQGTYFDLVVYAMHQTIACRNRGALSMHHAALSTIANMAAVATSWSMLSAMKLLALFEQFGKKELLDSAQSPDHMLGVLVYILATAMQYQFHGAAHVAYALLRRAKNEKDLWEYVKARSIAAEDVDVDEEEDETDDHDADADDEHENKPSAAAAAAATSGDSKAASSAAAVAASAKPAKTKLKRARFSRTLLTHVFTLKCTVEALEGNVHKKLAEDPNFDVHTLLQGVTLVGKMPVPHPLLLHRVPESREIDHWITSVVWSTIHTRPFRFLVVPAIRLFARPQPIRTDSSDSTSSSSSSSSSSGKSSDKDDDDAAASSSRRRAGKKPATETGASPNAAAVPIPDKSPTR